MYSKKETMAKTPFTLEDLKALQEQHGQVNMAILRDHLPKWKDKDIKLRLSSWRYKRRIDYKLDKTGDLTDVVILRIGRTKTLKTDSRGATIRSWFLCDVVSREMTIAEDTTSNKNQIQKADDLIAKYISRIPDDIVSLYFEDLPEPLKHYLQTKKA